MCKHGWKQKIVNYYKENRNYIVIDAVISFIAMGLGLFIGVVVGFWLVVKSMVWM